MNENILIYGSPEPSLWGEVVERAQEKRGSIVVVVPDQFKLETEQTLLKMLDRPLLHVQVMSLTGIARKVLSTRDIVPISHVGKRLFLIKILSENKDRLKIFGRHIHKQGFLRELSEILSDMTGGLKVQSLPEEDSAERTSNETVLKEPASKEPVSKERVLKASNLKELEDKIHDINLIYEAYSKISETYIGDEKLIGLAAGRAEMSSFVKDSAFYIAHYDFFTDNEYALYRALLEHSQGVKMTLLSEDTDVYAYTQRLLRKIPSSVEVRSERGRRLSEESAVAVGEGETRKTPENSSENSSENSFENAVENTAENAEESNCDGNAEESNCAGNAADSRQDGHDDRYAFFSALSESMFSQDLKRLEVLIRPYLRNAHRRNEDVGKGVAEDGEGGNPDVAADCASTGAPDGVREKRVVFSDDSPLEVYEFDTRYNEAAYAGDRILDLIRRGAKPSEITVVLPNWEAYEGMIEHVLARKEIPFFVDRDRVFEETPLAAFISALIDYNLAPNQKHLAKMLATEMFPIPVGEALKFQVEASENRFKPDATFEGILEMMRFRGLGGHFTVAAFVSELYRVLTTPFSYGDHTYSVMGHCEQHSFSMRHIVNETTAEVEYGARIWNAFMSVLEELYELSGISGEIDLSIARLLIDANARVARVPNQKEYVSITSPDRVRTLRSKYCFVLGALRGDLPHIARDASVFSPEEQERIQDADRITRFFDYEKEVYHLHLLLTAPGKCLVFTYPQGNRSVLLTYILEALGKKGYPRLETAANAPEDAVLPSCTLGIYTNCENAGDAGSAEALSNESANPEFYFSQSRLQSYLKCPFRYFIDYVVKAREERRNELSPMDSGNIVHRIMEIFVAEYSEADVLRTLDRDAVLARIEDSEAKYRIAVEEIYSRIAQEEEIVTADLKQGELYRRRFIEACTLYAQVIDFHLASGEYRMASTEGKMKGSEYFEGDFEADFGNVFPELFEPGDERKRKAFLSFMNRGRTQPMTIHLNGTFDRMDRVEDRYRLIDYKTGDSYDGRMSKLFLLDYIQLGLYAYLIELQEMEEKTAEQTAKKADEKAGGTIAGNDLESIGIGIGEDGAEGSVEGAEESIGASKGAEKGTAGDGADPDAKISVKNLVCEGLNILNLVDLDGGTAGRRTADNSASGAGRAMFKDKPMQGLVSIGDEERRHYCRFLDCKDAEGYETVVKKRSPKINPNYSFCHTGEDVARQREMLKTALLEAFEGLGGGRGERNVNMPALLRDAGERFFEAMKERQGIVEFDIITLWSRLITWAAAKSIAAGNFEPDTSDYDHCKYCNFKAICRYELRRG